MYCHIKMHLSPIKIATLPPLLLSLRLKTCIVSPWWPEGSVESPISTNVPLLLSSPHRNTSTLFLRSKHFIVDKRSTLPAANLRNMMLGMAKDTEPLIWASEKSECALQSRIRSLLGPFCDLSSLNSHSGSRKSSSITPPLPGILYSSAAFYFSQADNAVLLLYKKQASKLNDPFSITENCTSHKDILEPLQHWNSVISRYCTARNNTWRYCQGIIVLLRRLLQRRSSLVVIREASRYWHIDFTITRQTSKQCPSPIGTRKSSASSLRVLHDGAECNMYIKTRARLCDP